MKTPQLNTRERKRRFLLAVPLIVFPFMTLVFWALGGGQGASASSKDVVRKGFNSLLPNAKLRDDTAMDKMAFYEKAAKDSSDRRDLINNDPYYRMNPPGNLDNGGFGTSYYPGIQPEGNSYAYQGNSGHDPNEAKIAQKLEQLNMALQAEPNPRNEFGSYQGAENTDVARLKKMMEAMNAKEAADPEMDQLSGMLDKIMDIQNPARQQEKLAELSRQRKGRVYPVSMAKKRQIVSLLEDSEKQSVKDSVSGARKQENGFYSLEEDSQIAEAEQNAIEASVVETQTLVSGSTVKLRLLDDIYVNGQLIPRDNFVFGTATLNGERLGIRISSVRLKKSVFPVELAVIDIDGIEGIYIPGAIARDVAKESTDRAIQDLSFGASASNSIGIQAAGAGVEAAKSLFSKKVKLIKVTVKAGYSVLLRDEKQKQDTN